MRLFVMASDVSTCDLGLRGHANKLRKAKQRADLLKFSYVYLVTN